MPAEIFANWLSNYKANNEWQLCATKKRSKKECERELFKLTTEQWQHKFVENILAEPELTEDWPILDDTLCPCSAWLKRAKREQLFDLEELEQISLVHDKVHLIANTLFSKYQAGEIKQARSGLTAFNAAFDEMTSRIFEYA